MLFHVSSILLIVLGLCESAKILYVMPIPAKSHYNAQKDVPLALASRGHDVWVITPYEEESAPPTYHHVKVEPFPIWGDERINPFTLLDLSLPVYFDFLLSIGHQLSEFVFQQESFQSFLKEDHKFDVVINEVFVQESFYMLAHKYQAPLILLTTFGSSFKTNYYARNPLQLSTVYHEYGYSADPLSLFGRLRNLYTCLYEWFKLNYEYIPRQEQYALKYIKDLPQPVPSLNEVTANAALVLMNSHFSFDTPTAFLPNFIEVGGLHLVDSNKTLPKDLKSIMDNAKHGVVYLSFGSNVQSTDLSEDKLQAFLTVFSELKETVLMKWEDDTLENLPKNVIIRKWFPQKEILAHPNIKLFITHGGLIGLLEAISVGVPIIGVPVFGDQYLNILNTVENGHGELLNYKDINEKNLSGLVKKLLTEPKYKRNAESVAKKFEDRPMKPLDTAMWWIEYVIRNKETGFIKNPAIKMNFFEYHNLDVFLFLFMCITIPLLLVFILLKTIYKSIFKKSSKKVKKN